MLLYNQFYLDLQDECLLGVKILYKAFALIGRVFKNRIKIWYKKWCYIGVSKLLMFNILVYKIVLCKFA